MSTPQTKKKLGVYLLVIALLLILVNILAKIYFVRLDFTADRTYTLNPVTRQVLQSITRPVTITGYFTKDLPPDLQKTKDDFVDLITEYENMASSNNIAFEVLDPAGDEVLEEKAAKAGIKPVMLLVREKDQNVQKRAYFGMVIQYEDKEIPIPVISPDASLEYYVTMAIRELTQENKPRIAFIQGHGETSLMAMDQSRKMLESLYSLETISLSDTLSVQEYPTLVILNPTEAYTETDFANLDHYLSTGGNLFIGFQTVTFDYAKAEGAELPNGLSTWLQTKGLNVAPQFIVDADCGDIGVQQADAAGTVTKLPFPFFPIIKRFEEHPITYGMTAVVFQEASSITYVGSSATFTPLLRTSAKSGVVSLPYHIMVDRKWDAYDFPLGGLVVAATLEGPLSGPANNRMVVASNGSFATNGSEESVSLIADNVNLLANSIDWLSDDTGFIALRSKHVVSRNIRDLEAGTRMILKWVNFLLPILCIIGYGAFRVQCQTIRRKRNLESTHSA